MIKIVKFDDQLILRYEPYNDGRWILKKLKEEDGILIKNKFYFQESDYIGNNNDDDSYDFLIGKLVDNYYFFDKRILRSKFDVFFDKNYNINIKIFEINLSYENIFSALSEVYNGNSLYIGGEKADITIEEFDEMIKKMPTNYEKEIYTRSRIEEVAENYFPLPNKYKEKFEKYLAKKKLMKESKLEFIETYDVEKYKTVLDRLRDMFKTYNSYVEAEWQNEILKIIKLIMPQYVFALKEVSFKIDSKHKKRLDILLVNANGNIDIIEIKRYDSGSLIGKNKDSRGNYRPSIHLSSAIVQAEKYAYYCNVFSSEIKKTVEEKIKEDYSLNFDVNILNPKTIIIMGNDEKLDIEKKMDFELIRRMYSNVIDIITYGDLVERVEMIIKSLEARGD